MITMKKLIRKELKGGGDEPLITDAMVRAMVALAKWEMVLAKNNLVGNIRETLANLGFGFDIGLSTPSG